jgi:hypothetical protein
MLFGVSAANIVPGVQLKSGPMDRILIRVIYFLNFTNEIPTCVLNFRKDL